MQNYSEQRRSLVHALSFRQLAFIAAAVALMFVLPDYLVHWLAAVGFGIACLAVLILTKEPPSTSAATLLFAVGLIFSGFLASQFPRDALLSWRALMGIDPVATRCFVASLGLALGALLFLLWLGVIKSWRTLFANRPNPTFEEGRAKSGAPLN